MARDDELLSEEMAVEVAEAERLAAEEPLPFDRGEALTWRVSGPLGWDIAKIREVLELKADELAARLGPVSEESLVELRDSARLTMKRAEKMWRAALGELTERRKVILVEQIGDRFFWSTDGGYGTYHLASLLPTEEGKAVLARSLCGREWALGRGSLAHELPDVRHTGCRRCGSSPRFPAAERIVVPPVVVAEHEEKLRRWDEERERRWDEEREAAGDVDD